MAQKYKGYFYKEIECLFHQFLNYDMEILIDFNTKLEINILVFQNQWASDVTVQQSLIDFKETYYTLKLELFYTIIIEFVIPMRLG
jgi:hypothetical protein